MISDGSSTAGRFDDATTRERWRRDNKARVVRGKVTGRELDGWKEEITFGQGNWS